MRMVRGEQHRLLLASETEQQLMDCSYGQYLPFTFEEMLQYMHKLSRRNLIMSKIKSPLVAKDKEETRQDIVNYVRLFKAYKYIVDNSSGDKPIFLKTPNEDQSLNKNSQGTQNH